MGQVAAVVETCNRKTVAVSDIVYVLRRMGKPLYGFGGSDESSLRKPPLTRK